MNLSCHERAHTKVIPDVNIDELKNTTHNYTREKTKEKEGKRTKKVKEKADQLMKNPLVFSQQKILESCQVMQVVNLHNPTSKKMKKKMEGKENFLC